VIKKILIIFPLFFLGGVFALIPGAYISSFSKKPCHGFERNASFFPQQVAQEISLNESMSGGNETTKKKLPESRRIVLKTEDGLIRYGVLTLQPHAQGNVVLCHGAACDKEYMKPFAYEVFTHYNCLMFDFRRHGEATEGQYSTIGKKEIYEIRAAVEFLKNDETCKKLPIFGFGISMGGAALIEAQSLDSSLFEGLIIQSTFESLHRQAQRTFPLYRLPLFNLLIYTEPSRYFARKRYGVSVCKITPAKAIKKIKVPIFLIHGKRDQVIKFDAYERLKKAGKSIIKTWTPDTEKHTELYKALPGEFIKQTNEFLDEVLKKREKST